MILGLIPAKGRSTGVPGKNLKMIAGKPLLQWTIDVAKAANLDELILSTDSLDIAALGQKNGVRVLMRDPELARDDTPMVEVVKHALAQFPNAETVVLMQPTNPLRTWRHVSASIAGLKGCDSCVSFVRSKTPSEWRFRVDGYGYASPLKYDLEWSTIPSRRQEMHPEFERDGMIYTFRADNIRREGTIYGVTVHALIVDRADSCNIDEPEDWDEAERKLLAREKAKVA